MRNLAAVATVLIASTLPAAAQVAPVRTGPYFHASIGVAQPRDITGTVLGFEAKAEFDPGVTVAGGIGYRISENFRVEAEFGYANGSLNSVSVAGFKIPASALGVSDSIDAYFGFAAVYVDLPINQTIAPYVGGGLGAVHLSAFGGSATNFAGFLEGGVSLNITPNLALVPAFRYTFVDNGGDGFSRSDFITGKIGLRYSF